MGNFFLLVWQIRDSEVKEIEWFELEWKRGENKNPTYEIRHV